MGYKVDKAELKTAQTKALAHLSKTKPTILIGAGGTAGHVNPALAIARALMKINPNFQIVFCGNSGEIEASLVEKSEFNFYWMEAWGLNSKTPAGYFKTSLINSRGYRQARSLINKLNVVACIGAGGYVSFPLLLAAKRKKIKYFLHEQNAIPGRATKVFSPKANVVFTSYFETEELLPKSKKVIFSGNPVNESFFQQDKVEARKKLQIAEDEFYILVTGGSLGAKNLNDTCVKLAVSLENKSDELGKKVIIHLITGKDSYDEIKQSALAQGSALKVSDYSFNMPEEMAAADLVISRAGAGTCAELQALGAPSILIPYPYAINNHQEYNAKVLVDNGAAFKLDDLSLKVEDLENIILDLMNNPEKLVKMSEKAKEYSPKDAANIVATNICEELNK